MKAVVFSEEEKLCFQYIIKDLGNHHEFYRFLQDLQEYISINNALQRIRIKT